jgi:hypothetical protein
MKKSLVGNFWSIDNSVINKYIEGFTDGPCVPKKQLPASIR